jgi:dolichol kinase
VKPAPREPRRRLLHVLSGSIGLLTLVVNARASLAIIAGVLVLAVGLEIARHAWPGVAAVLVQLSGGAFRPHESRGASAPTLLAAGYLAAWLVAPGGAATGAILVAALADPAAALAGSRARPLMSGRTAAGSAAFLVVASVVLLSLGFAPVRALAAAALATVVERLAPRDTDNLAIPVVTAAALAIA